MTDPDLSPSELDPRETMRLECVECGARFETRGTRTPGSYYHPPESEADESACPACRVVVPGKSPCCGEPLHGVSCAWPLTSGEWGFECQECDRVYKIPAIQAYELGLRVIDAMIAGECDVRREMKAVGL